MLIIPPSTRKSRREAQAFTPNRPRPEAPVLIVNSVVAANVLTLTFDQPVTLSGVPKFTTDLPGQTVIAANKTAAATVALTFNEPIAGAVSLNVGFRDPAIRGASGGFVTSVTQII